MSEAPTKAAILAHGTRGAGATSVARNLVRSMSFSAIYHS
jgi:hypothetical protein